MATEKIYKLKVPFYKKSKSTFWALIRYKQKRQNLGKYSKYSHAEVLLPADYIQPKVKKNLIPDIIGDIKMIEKFWLSFSSEEWTGVRFKAIEFNPENWDFLEIEFTETQMDKMLDFALLHNWDFYNWIWIFFAQQLEMNKKGERTFFCSEISARILQEGWQIPSLSALFINPGQLAQILESKGYKIRNFNYFFKI